MEQITQTELQEITDMLADLPQSQRWLHKIRAVQPQTPVKEKSAKEIYCRCSKQERRALDAVNSAKDPTQLEAAQHWFKAEQRARAAFRVFRHTQKETHPYPLLQKYDLERTTEQLNEARDLARTACSNYFNLINEVPKLKRYEKALPLLMPEQKIYNRCKKEMKRAFNAINSAKDPAQLEAARHWFSAEQHARDAFRIFRCTQYETWPDAELQKQELKRMAQESNTARVLAREAGLKYFALTQEAPRLKVFEKVLPVRMAENKIYRKCSKEEKRALTAINLETDLLVKNPTWTTKRLDAAKAWLAAEHRAWDIFKELRDTKLASWTDAELQKLTLEKLPVDLNEARRTAQAAENVYTRKVKSMTRKTNV